MSLARTSSAQVQLPWMPWAPVLGFCLCLGFGWWVRVPAGNRAPAAGDDSIARLNYGGAMESMGRHEQALQQFERLLQLDPANAPAHNNLGNTLVKLGHTAEALEHYRRACTIDPQYAEAFNNLGNLLAQLGRGTEAEPVLETAHRLAPRNGFVLNNLAWVLATCATDGTRNAARAVQLAEEASQNTGGSAPNILLTLSAAYANDGRFRDAEAIAEQALEAALAIGNQDLARTAEAQRELFRSGQPLRLGQ